MSRVVVDASAVLALLNDEPGADIVEANLDAAVISAVNLAEVASILADSGVPEADIRFAVAALGIATIAFDANGAMQAGLLRPLTKAHGLSLGDRACLALAQLLATPVLTADRSWGTLDIDVDVRLIR